jgi:hypothetical protein
VCETVCVGGHGTISQHMKERSCCTCLFVHVKLRASWVCSVC